MVRFYTASNKFVLVRYQLIDQKMPLDFLPQIPSNYFPELPQVLLDLLDLSDYAMPQLVELFE